MTWRLRISLFALFLGFFLVILRLFYWQVIKAEELTKLGLSQYGEIRKIMPQRGEILASDSFPLATNKVTYLVYANPKEIKDAVSISYKLAPLLKADDASISASLSQNLFWVSLGGGVESSVRNKIESLKIPGIGFEQEYTRLYPEASLAATLLGFVGKDDAGEALGYFGVEGYYDRLLRGKEGQALQINDATGRPILARTNPFSQGVDGESLKLTIDRVIQFSVEKKIKEGVERFGATSGMVGIVEPKTGRILAMASYPSFDPKTYSQYPSSSYVNHFISSLYEPGSTFKPLVMSGALNENKVTPQTRCPACGGPVSVGGYSLHTWNDKYYPNSTMTEVIQHSDNTGMVFVGQTLGLTKMLKYLDKFGIGKLTGIDLQGEVTPQIKPKSDWYEADLATTAFGQGVNVTPIELLTVFSAIANGGKMMKPHVVSEIITADGKKKTVEPQEVGKPISSATARVMTEMLVNAVEKGEASYARLKGYRIAGKTGTASIPIGGKYDPEKTIASFVGFGPADDSKFAMIVIFNKPTAAIYGSETAAPAFFSIAKDILNYYGIPPKQ